jgi:hypothetical protein
MGGTQRGSNIWHRTLTGRFLNADSRFQNAAVLCSFVLVWLLAILVTNPIGDFPLNDDWAWGLDVKHLLEGNLRYTGWESMTLVTQVIWGAFFTNIFGFSFTVLRFSTMVALLFELFMFYMVIKEICDNKAYAYLFALSLMLNPIHFSLSHTFMTEIPFLALFISAIYYFVLNLQYGKESTMWFGLAFCVAATFIRQFAVILPAAFGVAFLYMRGISKGNLARFFALIFSCYLLLMGYERLLAEFGRTPYNYYTMLRVLTNWFSESLLQLCYASLTNNDVVLFLDKLKISIFSIALEQFLKLIEKTVSVMYVIIGYCGFSLLPFLVLRLRDFYHENKRLTWRIVIGSAIVTLCARITMCSFSAENLFSYHDGNILSLYGLGMTMLADTFMARKTSPDVSVWLTFSLTLLELISTMTLVAVYTLIFVHKIRQHYLYIAVAIVMTLSLSMYCIIISLIPFFDRYALIPLVFIGITISCRQQFRLNKKEIVSILLFLLALGSFSAIGTREYMAWNRAKWNALDFLVTEQDVPPNKIDGGFEFNGLYLFDPSYARTNKKSWCGWIQTNSWSHFGKCPAIMCSERFLTPEPCTETTARYMSCIKILDAVPEYSEAHEKRAYSRLL